MSTFTQPGDCRGSGAEFEAVNPTASYDAVRCSCLREFTVRVVRSRNRVPLPVPIVTVPRHRSAP
jgi:hypothetical protein